MSPRHWAVPGSDPAATRAATSRLAASVRRLVARFRDIANGSRPVWIPTKNGTHRAGGRWAGLAAYRQPALLAAVIAVAVLLVTDPPAERVDTRPTAAARADRRAAAPGDTDANGNVRAPARAEPAPAGAGRQGPGQPAAPAPAPPKPPAAPGTGVAPNAPASPSASPAPTRAAYGPARSRRLTGTDAVALTFDDGPDAEQTPRMLDLLAQHRVKATFCVVGFRVQAHPELVRRIVADGHTLCNHSWDHNLALGKKTPEEIKADLERTNAAIRAAAPDARIAYFRAPGGNFTDELVHAARALGMTSIYWEVDPRDWDHPEGETAQQHLDRVVHAVEHSARKGSIVLSHDYRQPQTITAYETLIPWLQKRYELVAPPVAPAVQAGR